ncbi:MAG TPA: GNAT family protein [Magnetospirillaceae bacterium]|nr:GNAT family protein [Magnetospirillaceae bacterium]
MLRGQKIVLGPITPNDFQALFRWGDDVEAARLNETYRPAVWKNQEELWYNVGRDPSRVFFSIRKAEANAIVGYVQITGIDAVHRSATLGLRIGEAADRCQGYGREALGLAISYCWNHLNLSRIGLAVFATNERALRLYSSFGFQVEGRLRNALFIDGAWIDCLLMGLLHPSRAGES